MLRGHLDVISVFKAVTGDLFVSVISPNVFVFSQKPSCPHDYLIIITCIPTEWQSANSLQLFFLRNLQHHVSFSVFHGHVRHHHHYCTDQTISQV